MWLKWLNPKVVLNWFWSMRIQRRLRTWLITGIKMDGNWIGLSTLCRNIRIHRGYTYMFLINYSFSSIGSQNSHLVSQLASNLCLRDFRFHWIHPFANGIVCSHVFGALLLLLWYKLLLLIWYIKSYQIDQISLK